MARIRSIKPEFWTSGQIVECSTNARLLFIGLWNFCDDAGRMSFSEKKVKAQIFPADDISLANVRRMIDELSTNGLIYIYVIDNVEYLQVTGWHHQRIDRPQKSRIPPPPENHSTNIRRTFVPDRIGEDKIGRDSKRVSDETLSSNAGALVRVSKKSNVGDDPEFIAWWQAYPRREAKGQARRAYATARKKTSPDILLIAAQRAAKLYAATEQRFIPLPATWLNGERWADDAQQPNSKPVDWRSVL